ncbi:hypothetical protein C0J52_00522 [Blattella germanica]|nr:hypothetical protein C0J52_00522 [Blattella germanica]
MESTLYKPTWKIQECLRSAKDTKDPKLSGGVYRIPCSCGAVYARTTKHSIKTRIGENRRHCHLFQMGKSSVAKHSINTSHDILFNVILYHMRLHREAIEIYKNKNCYNKKEESLKVNKIWQAVL